MSNNSDILEQYDYLDNKYLQEIKTKYSRLIGSFLIQFSELEHELNVVIAERHFSRHKVPSSTRLNNPVWINCLIARNIRPNNPIKG